MELYILKSGGLGRGDGKGGVVDVSALSGWDVGDPQHSIETVLERGTRQGSWEFVAELDGPRVESNEAELVAPLPRPSKIIAAPLNYHAHAEEMGRADRILANGLFLKAPSSIVGPQDEICLPFSDREVHQEAELGVVIGAPTYRIGESEAASAIAGYCCLLDITIRGQEDRSWRKSFRTFTPIGPSIVTSDAIADPNNLGILCRVNGETRQQASTSEMILDVWRLVAFAAWAFPLMPGDIIATGTPPGVTALEPGDKIAVEIEDVGVMEVSVADEYAGRFADWEFSGVGG